MKIELLKEKEIAIVSSDEKIITDTQSALDLVMTVKYETGTNKIIMEKGNISERDMFNTFNMGVGMTVVVSASDAEKALQVLKENGEDAYIVGKIEKNENEKIILE